MKYSGLAGAAALALFPVAAFAAVDGETAYILNTLLFLVMGVLVMFMAAGFAMLEAGMVRYRSVASIVLKNTALYAVAGIMFFLVGYNMMYMDVDGGYMGSLMMWSADDAAAIAGDYSAGYASASDWFFQMVFVATAVSIVSGAVAERMKIEPFLLFAVLLAGFMYPITGSWQWGGGWLSEMGFSDFAGSTLVHSVGGWAALAGIIILGPRLGRFDEAGKPVPMLPSSVALVGLGVFVLWFGWFGFNGGSQLALGSAEDAIAVSTIFANTNTGAAAGVIAALLFTRIRNGRFSIYDSLNGALGGLVSITAEPLTPSLPEAALIGAVGGVLVVLASILLEKLKLDDVVGAIPVHLVCGIWGTMAVPITNPDTSFGTQAVGVLAVGAFTFVVSFILWSVIKAIIGLRLPAEEEAKGLDIAELEVSGYPYFEERQVARS
tara:strand:+ start:3086 stop:4393 length:1308 start_codon:yes stop_codon:yes gene_type:complete